MWRGKFDPNIRIAMKNKIKPVLAFLLLFLSGCMTIRAGDIKIVDAWAQATLLAYSEKMSEHAYHIPVGSDTAVYFQKVNEGQVEDSLIEGFSDVCEKVEIFGAEGNEIRLLPGEKVVLSPKTGLSIRLRNLNQDLLPSQKINITLIFKNQGQVELLVPVKLPQN